jgi:hypothetical protein
MKTNFDPSHPQNPPASAYCPCCGRLSDCCICSEGNATYYGKECQNCKPLSKNKIQVLEVPPPFGTILSTVGETAIEYAKIVGADAILIHPVTLPNGTVLPANTPMKVGQDGYWRPVDESVPSVPPYV